MEARSHTGGPHAVQDALHELMPTTSVCVALQSFTLAALHCSYGTVWPPQCPAGLLPAVHHHAHRSQLKSSWVMPYVAALPAALGMQAVCWKALTCPTMQGCYQLFWLFLIIYGAPARISRYHVTTECETMTMLHTNEYAGSTSINLSNVTTTPPYRSLDLCCSGTDCYEGGVYYQGGRPQLTCPLEPHSALFNERLDACSQVCMPPGVYSMAIWCGDKGGFAALPLQEHVLLLPCAASTAVQTSSYRQPEQPARAACTAAVSCQ